MINFISTTIMIVIFFLSGYIIQGLKKLLQLITKTLLKIISFFGIKLKDREKSIKVSDEFKQYCKDVKIVKLSNKNIKEKSSIDWLNLGLFLASLTLIICNLAVISGNAISNWLFNLIKNFKLIKNTTDMNTMFTAIVFSTLSFSATKLFQRWKETKQNRKEKKAILLKLKALDLMSSKELIEEAKKKDDLNKKSLQ